MTFQPSGRVIGRNALLNLSALTLALVVGVVTLPFIIRGLGADRFGLLSLAWVILGYFTVFDLGLARATTRYVAQALGSGRQQDIPRLVWTAASVQLVCGMVGAAILIAATPALVAHVLNIPPELVGEARGMLRLLALGIPVVLVSGSFGGALEAAQRYDLVNLVKAPSNALTFLIPLAGALGGLSLPHIVALMVGARFIALLAFAVLALRVFPSLRSFAASRAVLPGLLTYGGWIMLTSILAPLLVYTDRFVLGAVAGLAAVAYYTAPFEAITRLSAIPSSLAAALFPALSALGGASPARVQQLYLRSVKYLALLTCPMTLALFVIAPDALRLWLGAEFARHGAVPLQVLLLGALAILLAPVPANLIQALGRPDLIAKLYLCYLPANLLLVWFLVSRFGVVGAAVSFTLRAWVESAFLLIMSSRLIGLSAASIARDGVARALGLIAAFAVFAGSATFLSDPLLRASIVSVGLLAFLVVAWRYILDGADKGLLLSVIRYPVPERK